MQKYIIFQAESGEDEGWRERKPQHSQALTFIIAENWTLLTNRFLNRDIAL